MLSEPKNKCDIWDPYFHRRFKGYKPLLTVYERMQLKGSSIWPCLTDYQRIAPSGFEFVTQTPSMQYETQIVQHSQIPTRLRCWHDFFNNLTWARFPRLKWALTQTMIAQKVQPARNGMQNLIAHLDECGIVICSTNTDLFDFIKAFEWKRFFLDKRLNSQCYPCLIGHGLHERLLSPFLGLTAKAVFLRVPKGFLSLSDEDKIAYIDENMADYINSEAFPSHPKALHPFPFLGWPGWFNALQDSCFYDNARYFRPSRNVSEEYVGSAYFEGKTL